jgi:L-alanine-DL-glutamate epimerase-like enolase superfamily enzyme
VEDARNVIAAEAADILVVKPMTAGGPRPGRAILEMARAAGLAAIVTTTLDAGVGVAMALHLAATSDATVKAPPMRACGLATGSLLESDLLRTPLPVLNGVMSTLPGPGLGITLDDSALARYASAWHSVT